MPSNKALKTDVEAELVLLSQIEKFAVENDFDMDLLYDVELVQHIFGPELKRLEGRIAECDAAIRQMERRDRDLGVIYCELDKIQRNNNLKIEIASFWDYGAVCHSVYAMHYVMAQRRSNFRRRAWEMRTYIKACHQRQYISKLLVPISQVVTQHMWGSAWREAVSARAS